MALRFDIDPHGRVVPGGDAVSQALGDRAGRFLLLPSVPDLLVARRQPGGGGQASGERCVLCGDLAAFPIADFLGFLHTARLGGTLTVATAGLDRTVLLKEGEVRGVVSEAPGERLGEVALRLGFLGPAQLEEVLKAPRPVGKSLVDKGLLKPAELWKCFHEQVTSVFHAILQAREGTFALVDRVELDGAGGALAVNTQQLLMDGIRRIDEMELFRGRIPGPGTYLRARQPRRPVQLQPLEEQLLGLVNGARRLREIAAAAHLSEFDATKVLYHLAEAGYVEALDERIPTPVPAAAPGEGGAAGDRQARIVAGMNAIYREVAAHVAAARALEEYLSAVRDFLADGTSRFAPLWRGLAPGRDGALDPATLLANLAAARAAGLQRLEATGDPGRYLFDGMRELLFFQLFQAGEKLDRAADESLSGQVKRALEALGSLR